MENNTRTIIITTRFYPTSEGWSELDFIGSLDYRKPHFLDFNGVVDKQTSFSQKPSIKYCELDSFRLCVVPCLKEGLKAVTRVAYLEDVVGLVCNQLCRNRDLDERVFLVAHDKDFSSPREDGAVVGKKHFEGRLTPHSSLSRLVENNHVYMFMHGPKTKLGWFINTEELDLVNKDLTRMESDCQEMLKIIVKEIEMAEFLRDLNNDSLIYPKPNCNE